MSARITEKDLQNVVDRINLKLFQSTPSYYPNGNACVGNYYLSSSYGGFSLHQITNDRGGCCDVLNCGYITKKDLYNKMWAFYERLGQAV